MVSSRRNHSLTGGVLHRIVDYAFVVNAIINARGVLPNGGATAKKTLTAKGVSIRWTISLGD
jgi:hypothetical protein